MKNAANVQTVTKNKHSKLRLKPNPDFVHARNSNLVAITLMELGNSINNFPVVFIQNPDDKRYLLAGMLGLRSNENLLYNKDGWDSTYVPMAIRRHPFVIGFDDSQPEKDIFTTCIDIDYPFLNEEEGLPLFKENGEETDFMKDRHRLLNTLFEAEKHTELFIRKLQELDLLTSLDLVLQSEKGELLRVAGLSTIDEVKLKNLSEEKIIELHKLDFLPPCYLILVSLYQLNHLVKLRNRKDEDKVATFQIDFGKQNKPEEQAQAGK